MRHGMFDRPRRCTAAPHAAGCMPPSVDARAAPHAAGGMPPSVEARSGCGPHASPGGLGRSACRPRPSPACFAWQHLQGRFSNLTPTKSPCRGSHNLEIWVKIRLQAKSLFCLLRLKISEISLPLVFFCAYFDCPKSTQNPFWKSPSQ